MPKVIVGIHGLGNKPPKSLLQQWWLESMKEGLKKMEPSLKMPEFELVYWADILNLKPLDETISDIDDLYFLDEKYTPAPLNYQPEDHPIRRKIMEFIEQHMDKVLLNGDFTLRFPYLSEAIMNRYFYELGLYFNNNGLDKSGARASAKSAIRSRLVDALKKYEGYEVFLIAHSMGSIVAYDVLSLLLPHVKISTFVTIGSPLGIPVVFSKIVTDSQYKALGHLKPQTPSAIEHHWYNLSDPDDRIAFDHTLSDDFEPNEKGVKAVDISVNNDYVIDNLRNPHKSFGYLRTKEFSKILFHFITAKERLSFGTIYKHIQKRFRSLVNKKSL